MKGCLLLPLLLCLAPGLEAQRKVLIVDVTGKASSHKTIMSAVKLAKSGDQIWILPGDYKEAVLIDGLSLTLLGLGKKASDVNISGVPSNIGGPTLTIKRVPKGGRCVVSRMGAANALSNFHAGLVVENCAGDIVLEEFESRFTTSCSKVTATVSFQHCRLGTSFSFINSSRRAALELDRVQFCLIESSELTNSALGKGLDWSGLKADRSTVDISNSNTQGGFGMKGRGGFEYPGGPGILLTNSTAFLRGRATNKIVAGNPVLNIYPPPNGADAIHLVNSKLVWSGVSLIPGAGKTIGLKIGSTNSVVTHMTPALPLLIRKAPFAAGSQTSFQIQSQPGAISVSWLTLGARPLATPVGLLVADLQTLLLPLATVHDAKGLGIRTLDLRNIAKRHRGEPFFIQTLCMDKSFRLSLTNALVNIVH